MNFSLITLATAIRAVAALQAAPATLAAAAALPATPSALRPTRALQRRRTTVARQEPPGRRPVRVAIRWPPKEAWAPLLAAQALILCGLLVWMTALAPEQMRAEAAQRRTACANVRLFTSSVCVPIQQPLRLRGGGMTLARGRDPYEVLGVARGASLAAVRAAYRKQARALHPDSSGDPATAEEFREVVSAFLEKSF